MKSRILLLIMAAAVAFMFMGCKKEEGPVDTTLTIQETRWAEAASFDSEPLLFTPLKAGDELYDRMQCTVAVESVSEERIVLDLGGCLVEENANGTINLNADPLEEVELSAGESITLVSQTMDAGIRIVITYEG